MPQIGQTVKVTSTDIVKQATINISITGEEHIRKIYDGLSDLLRSSDNILNVRHETKTLLSDINSALAKLYYYNEVNKI